MIGAEGNAIPGTYDAKAQVWVPKNPADTIDTIITVKVTQQSLTWQDVEWRGKTLNDVNAHFEVLSLSSPPPGLPITTPTWVYTGTYEPDPACRGECYAIVGSINANPTGELTNEPSPGRGFSKIEFTGGKVQTVVVTDEDGNTIQGGWVRHARREVWKPDDPSQTVDTKVTVKIIQDTGTVEDMTALQPGQPLDY